MISARPAFSARALAVQAALVLAGSGILALSAQIAVPMVPVPITMQTLAIPLLVLTIGTRLSTLAALAYLAEGACGLPVFSGLGGLVRLAGPTAGFLWTFPLAALAVGVLLDRGLASTYPGRWLAVFGGTAIIFAGGAWWLSVGVGLSPADAVMKGVYPFIIGDILKTSIAAGLSPQWPRLQKLLGL
jgi:biotin transport system substrate-specific component